MGLRKAGYEDIPVVIVKAGIIPNFMLAESSLASRSSQIESQS
jgi:hypothetical protein